MIDLGTGHGLICRALARTFDHVVGTDPSEGMIREARSLTSKAEYPNVDFTQASAESLPFLQDNSVDMVVSGQAAHWFHQRTFFQEMSRIVRPNGTLAMWGYSDHVFPGHPTATRLLHETAYGMQEDLLGSYWQQPGRSIVQDFFRDIKPPSNNWDVDRREHDPSSAGPHFLDDRLILRKRMTPLANQEYMRTWSAYHGWKEAHPHAIPKNAGGKGDIVDFLFERIRDAEPDWAGAQNWMDTEIDVEWGTALILARRKA